MQTDVIHSHDSCLESAGTVSEISGFYDVRSGRVTFFKEKNTLSRGIKMPGTEIFQAIDKITSADELLGLLSGFYAAFGFEAICIVSPRASEPGKSDLIHRGMPAEWMEKYLSLNFGEIDPIPTHTMQNGSVERLHALLRSHARRTNERAYAAEFFASSMTDGLAIPTHGAHRARGFFGLAQICQRRLDQVDISLLHAVAQHAHWRIDQLEVEGTPSQNSLSPREVEILRWIAAGKSNPDIATILGISMPTVATHMKRLFAKLGVNDRVSAALTGYRLGFVL